MISQIAVAGRLVFSISPIIRDDLFKTLLGLLVALEVEVALGNYVC